MMKIQQAIWKRTFAHFGLNEEYTDCPTKVNELIAEKFKARKLYQRNRGLERKKIS